MSSCPAARTAAEGSLRHLNRGGSALVALRLLSGTRPAAAQIARLTVNGKVTPVPITPGGRRGSGLVTGRAGAQTDSPGEPREQ